MIKEILETLPVEDRKALMYAFNELFCHIQDLPNNHFVGVHIEDVSDMEIKETNGVWFYGRYK